MRENYYLGER